MIIVLTLLRDNGTPIQEIHINPFSHLDVTFPEPIVDDTAKVALQGYLFIPNTVRTDENDSSR
jgi:hypothetical protein